MKTKEENDATDWHEEFRKWEKGFWKRVVIAIIVMMAGLLILLSINTISSKAIGCYIIIALLIFFGCIFVWLQPAYGKGRIFDKLEEENREVEK